MSSSFPESFINEVTVSINFAFAIADYCLLHQVISFNLGEILHFPLHISMSVEYYSHSVDISFVNSINCLIDHQLSAC
jgi:hypothetical protein